MAHKHQDKDHGQPHLPKQTSFFGSMMSGIGGAIKGALGGGIVGAVGGALVGAAILGVTAATGGLAAFGGSLALAAAATILPSIGVGAGTLGALGASAGLVTGVVKSREAAQPSANDIVNVAKVSFAQGVNVGQHTGQEKGNFMALHEQREKQRVMMQGDQRTH